MRRQREKMEIGNEGERKLEKRRQERGNKERERRFLFHVSSKKLSEIWISNEKIHNHGFLNNPKLSIEDFSRHFRHTSYKRFTINESVGGFPANNLFKSVIQFALLCLKCEILIMKFHSVRTIEIATQLSNYLKWFFFKPGSISSLYFQETN